MSIPSMAEMQEERSQSMKDFPRTVDWGLKRMDSRVTDVDDDEDGNWVNVEKVGVEEEYDDEEEEEEDDDDDDELRECGIVSRRGCGYSEDGIVTGCGEVPSSNSVFSISSSKTSSREDPVDPKRESKSVSCGWQRKMSLTAVK